MHAKRGKVIKVEKVREYGSERAKAYVIFDIGNGQTDRVRARDVINFWEDYEREHGAAIAEREAAQRLVNERFERREQERAARRQELEAEEARAAARKVTLVETLCDRTGMLPEMVVGVGSENITLNRHMIELWLSVR